MYTKYTTEVAVDHHYLHCLRGEKGYEVFDKTLVEDLTKTDDQFNCLAKHFRKTRARTGPRRSSSGPRSNRKGTMTSPTNVPSSMCSFMNNANFTHVNLEGTGECNIVYNYWRKTTKIGSRWRYFAT
ncbi:hypothetical protein JHK82_044874 [Glycine max]|nr:hypothetical protein JHK82_044874 [Glycine max]